MRLGRALDAWPRRFEELKNRNKELKSLKEGTITTNSVYDIQAETPTHPDAQSIVGPWLQKASNDHQPRKPLSSLSALSDRDSLEPEPDHPDDGSGLTPGGLAVINESKVGMLGEDITVRDRPRSNNARALQLRLPPSHMKSKIDTDADTPLSQAEHPLDSELAGNVIVVYHHAQPSLTFTASIEEYAHKADQKNWGPAVFKKGQIVRLKPGTYPVPHKKLSESRHNYTQLGSFTKGTVHMLNRETSTGDPREFVLDERDVMYRVWIPGKVNSTVEFVFALEVDMVPFVECANCGGYATEQCGGCQKVRYCSEYCLASDWKNHKAKCDHKGKTQPMLGVASSKSSDVSYSTNSDGVKNKPGPIRKKFREDGTVKVVNAYTPDPATLKGRTVILPKCLRPLTLEEVHAPEPQSYMLRLARRQSHKLRKRLYKNQTVSQPEEGQVEHPETIIEENEEMNNTGGSNVDIPYSAGKSPLGRSSRMGYNGENANEKSLDGPSGEALFGWEEVPQPSSGKSAESLVEGGPPNKASRFSRNFFARLPPIKTTEPSKVSGEMDLGVSARSGSHKSSPTADSNEKTKSSVSSKLPKALKKLSRRSGEASGTQISGKTKTIPVESSAQVTST